jgi:hypothetical protein
MNKAKCIDLLLELEQEMYQTEDMRKFQILELIDQIKLLLSFLSE